MDEPEASRGSLHFVDVVMEAQRGQNDLAGCHSRAGT